MIHKKIFYACSRDLYSITTNILDVGDSMNKHDGVLQFKGKCNWFIVFTLHQTYYRLFRSVATLFPHLNFYTKFCGLSHCLLSFISFFTRDQFASLREECLCSPKQELLSICRMIIFSFAQGRLFVPLISCVLFSLLFFQYIQQILTQAFHFSGSIFS